MTFNTSVVAAHCSKASSRSRVRPSSWPCRSAIVACVLDALRALGLFVPAAASPAFRFHRVVARRPRAVNVMLNPREILDFAPWEHVRFRSKADMCGAKRHVRFTSENGHVRCNLGCPLWAETDIRLLIRSPRRLALTATMGLSESERLCGFQVDDQIEFGCLFHRQIARVGGLRDCDCSE